MRMLPDRSAPDPFSRERLVRAWFAYRRGKRRIAAVGAFEMRLPEEVARLAFELACGTYVHSPYRAFTVFDPKRRTITAAALRDRIVHQVVYEEVERVFEPTFLDCSYSGLKGRGVHAAIDAAERAIAVLRSQGVWPIYAIKLDARKFYDSVDHAILQRLLARRIYDPHILSVIQEILVSYTSPLGAGKGIPIGNLTSQVFANAYLHELDRYAKRAIYPPKYFRYADDVLLLGGSLRELVYQARQLSIFAYDQLAIELRIARGFPRKLSQGVDFLGTVLWPYGRTLRKATRKRILRRIDSCPIVIRPPMLASYRGIAMRVRDQALSALLAPPSQTA